MDHVRPILVCVSITLTALVAENIRILPGIKVIVRLAS
jgi:hypothetical protein